MFRIPTLKLLILFVGIRIRNRKINKGNICSHIQIQNKFLKRLDYLRTEVLIFSIKSDFFLIEDLLNFIRYILLF